MTNEYSSKAETFLTWIMANRDVSARTWTDKIEPEVSKQLTDLITQAQIEILDKLHDSEYWDGVIGGDRYTRGLAYEVDDLIAKLQSTLKKEQ